MPRQVDDGSWVDDNGDPVAAPAIDPLAVGEDQKPDFNDPTYLAQLNNPSSATYANWRNGAEAQFKPNNTVPWSSINRMFGGAASPYDKSILGQYGGNTQFVGKYDPASGNVTMDQNGNLYSIPHPGGGFGDFLKGALPVLLAAATAGSSLAAAGVGTAAGEGLGAGSFLAANDAAMGAAGGFGAGGYTTGALADGALGGGIAGTGLGGAGAAGVEAANSAYGLGTVGDAASTGAGVDTPTPNAPTPSPDSSPPNTPTPESPSSPSPNTPTPQNGPSNLPNAPPGSSSVLQQIQNALTPRNLATGVSALQTLQALTHKTPSSTPDTPALSNAYTNGVTPMSPSGSSTVGGRTINSYNGDPNRYGMNPEANWFNDSGASHQVGPGPTASSPLAHSAMQMNPQLNQQTPLTTNNGMPPLPPLGGVASGGPQMLPGMASTLMQANANNGMPPLPPLGGVASGGPQMLPGMASTLMQANANHAYARGGLTQMRDMISQPSDAAMQGIQVGPGAGQDDKIDARLSDGEYVFDADTVAALGDGSTKAGAQRLDMARQKIRSHKRSAPASRIPPKAKPFEHYLGAR